MPETKICTEAKNCAVQTTCGGCPNLHLPRKEELRTKRELVAAAFEQQGLPVQLPDVITGPNRFGYRNRIRLAVIDGRAGFFNQAKRNGCPALLPNLWQAVATLISTTERHPNLLAGCPNVEVRVTDHNQQIGLSIATDADPSGHRQKRLEEEQLIGLLGDSWCGAQRAAPNQPTLPYLLDNKITIDVPIDAFVQVNSEVNRLLVQHVTQTILASGSRTFLDLFAGSGNLSLPLIHHGLRGVAVEQDGSAIKALSQAVTALERRALASPALSDTARSGATLLGAASRSATRAADVYREIESLEPADVVICNPPRAGIKQNPLSVGKLAKQMMVYVGCNPRSLARDIAQFATSGLTVDKVQTFDMFPGTSHIETVVTLKRR